MRLIRGRFSLALAAQLTFFPASWWRSCGTTPTTSSRHGRPNPHGLVFPSPNGGHWLDTNFDRRVWKRAREEAGLTDLTFTPSATSTCPHVRAQGLATALTEQVVGHVDERTHQGYTRPIAGTEPLIRAALAGAFGGRCLNRA